MPKFNMTTIVNAAECYQIAEQKAIEYFKSLYQQLAFKTYSSTLTKDILSWKHNHIHHHSFLSGLFGRKDKPNSQEYHKYIHWLDYTGKLDNYLDRSIAYIFLRDLGKALDSPATQARIQHVVDSLKEQLTRSVTLDRANGTEKISFVGLYRNAQKEGVGSTLLWVLDKLKTMSDHLPKELDAVHAQRKVIKIIAGVLMHEIEEMSSNTSPEERSRKIDEAIRLGYSYGLTYPLIDDLLDSKVLSLEEKKRYSELIRTTLITGNVPELGEWIGMNSDLVKYVHSELSDSFEYIKVHQRPGAQKSFFELAYVFFNAQDVDRVKDLSNQNYSNEDLYIPVILKSSFSRLIARSVISAPVDIGFDNRTFYYGIYNQLADDFSDMFEDLKEERVTPYTYYIKYHVQRQDLINPFELYWTVISNLIHNVYHSDTKTCEVILDRAINGLKRFKERMGTERYDEVMGLFASVNPKFNDLVQKMVRKADDVDFLDKLLRDRMITILKNEKAEQEAFVDTIQTVGKQISGILNIAKTLDNPLLNQTIIDSANYSLEAGGKKVRPLMAWAMGVNGYGLDPKAIAPLLRSLEYMHTASLIYDDLPSQDNAYTRRGRQTLHVVYNIAIAELTGLFLTQKAIEELTSLDPFDPKIVLNLIQYATRLIEDMCKGQAMDLDSKGKRLTLEQLNMMYFYKTGLAFEASLVMPAILAQEKEAQIEALKEFAHHAGIAFQIKDDLLDAEGDPVLLGKLTGKDVENNNSTFVTLLGSEGARKEMWDHYCQAMEELEYVPRNTTFLKQLLNYIVKRDH
ncbi:polyprenyl synthetase family protein [Desulfitobacterium metallireducens]|uniref:polyprenyl synthetase family protein n=1 Tax=Desulfitobacterium metallireducens TaxID=142877 RepID=UPI001FA73933|nr:polyprenyl synthetase family protein [Desulfitobacterium metallireducens]